MRIPTLIALATLAQYAPSSEGLRDESMIGRFLKMVKNHEEAGIDRENLKNISDRQLAVLAAQARESRLDRLSKEVDDEMARRRTQRLQPFIRATQEGDAKAIRIFIDSGADIDIQDRDGDTLLMHAIRNGQATIASALKRAGARDDIPNLLGTTAIKLMHDTTRATITRARKKFRGPFYDADHPSHNKFLMGFYHAYEDFLTLDDAIALAKAITVDLPKHDILGFFFRNRRHTMTTDDAIALARAQSEIKLTYDMDETLWNFLQTKIGDDFPIDEALKLARAAQNQEYYDLILRSFFDAKRDALSPEELESLAEATTHTSESTKLRHDIRAITEPCKTTAAPLLR